MTPTTLQISTFLSGALTIGYWIAALFFLRYWQRSRDRLFAKFSAAFFLLGVQRIALSWLSGIGGMHDTLLWPFIIRLAAFGVILWAIIEKNRSASRNKSDH